MACRRSRQQSCSRRVTSPVSRLYTASMMVSLPSSNSCLSTALVGQDVVGTLSDILPHCRVNQFVALGMLFRANHGGINLVHNGLQVRRGHLFAGASRLHRAAAGMSHNHEHAAGQVLDGVLDASKTNRISNVARRAHHK
jgi:hypothetical protein